jgi:tetratricopeptide (TPR) repeat protein
MARDAIALGRELGSVRTPALARLAAGRAAIRLGRPQSGARALRTAREAVRSRRVKVMYGDIAEAEAMAALDRGAWGAARDGARRLSAALRAVPMGLWAPLPALIEGRAHLGAGRMREAVVAFDDAIRAARSAGAEGSLELARWYRAQAATIGGLGAGRTPPPPSADGAEAEIAAVAAETAGAAALVRGDPRDAVTALDLAIERWQAFGSTSWLARASALRAEALRASGDRARAAASLGRARTIADAVGMPKAERPSIEHPLGEAT